MKFTGREALDFLAAIECQFSLAVGVIVAWCNQKWLGAI